MTFRSLLILLCGSTLAGPVVAQSKLDAPAAPTAPGSAMYTLADLYNRLVDGTAGTVRAGGFTEPAAGPTVAGTMYTLDQIMGKMPTVDANGATETEVLSGKTFWGLTSGAWGVKTGTVTAGANVTGSDGALSIEIPNGLYSGGKTATANDSDLTAGNIKSGVNLFGIAGTFTSDADAVASDLLSGKKAYVNGTLVTGTVTAGVNVTGTDGQLSIAIPNGLYSGGKTCTAQDANLSSTNVKTGATIFGVVGSYTCTNPTGDAAAGDVLTGKTFSNASGTGLSGQMPDKEGDNASTDQSYANSTVKFTAPTGFYDGDDTVTATEAQVVALESADLTTGNIKKDVQIFGVTGAAIIATGDAAAGDVLAGKIFSNSTSAGLTGTRLHTALPKTGQTTVYATGDDGDLQKGMALPSPRFTNNDNGTVTDNLTGLIWLRNANCVAATRPWTTALSDVAQLNTNGTMNGNNCGDTSNNGSHQTDWRLPNARELLSLIDFTTANPVLSSGHPFLNVVNHYYWSSTTFVPTPGAAHAVHIGGGVMNGDYKHVVYSVWPVRGGL